VVAERIPRVFGVPLAGIPGPGEKYPGKKHRNLELLPRHVRLRKYNFAGKLILDKGPGIVAPEPYDGAEAGWPLESNVVIRLLEERND
jgi:hypothetical protein